MVYDREGGRILVAVGTFGVGDAAVSYAVTEASRAGAGIHLVHVVPPSSVVGAAERGRLEVVGAYRLKIASRLARERSSGAVLVTAELVDGVVLEALVERSVGARLVVLERPALVVLDGQEAPSVTRGLGLRSAAPVVMVPPRWEGHRDEAAPVVVASIDDPAHSRTVIGSALAAGRALQAQVEFVHSWWYADGEADAVEGVSEQRILPRRAVETLVEVSRRSELIVTARRTGEGGDSLSPATSAALYEALCPVLVVAGDEPTDVLASRRRFSLVRGA